jgi:hypothetical protein
MIDMACDGGGEARFSEDRMTANAFGRAATGLFVPQL